MSELQNFVNILKEDKKRAKALFFSESFKKEYLENYPEYQDVYHQLLLGRNREQILEEFLITAGQKEAVHLSAAKTLWRITKNNMDEPLMITIKKNGWGYLEGKVKVQGDFLALEKDTFVEADFVDNLLEIPVYLDDIPQNGEKAEVVFETIQDCLKIEVVYEGEEVKKRGKEPIRWRRMFDAYVKFCSGKISKSEFSERVEEILAQMQPGSEYTDCYDLIRLHLKILNGEKDLDQKFPEEERISKMNHLAKGYLFYLKALYNKSEESLKKAVEEIKVLEEEKDKFQGFFLWYLMNLDAELAYDPQLQLEKMKELHTFGDRNPLLQFEACCLFGEKPQLLQHLEDFELHVLEFAAREKLMNEGLIQRICFIISREKIFSENLLWLLMCIYEEYPISNVLQGICAMMIQGNCMEHDCHPYYEKALQEGIQLIGLQEAFLRTIPSNQYPVLPEEILIYFSYSNSLSRKEQSFLYANVVINRRKYQNIFPNYEEMIRQFLADELKKEQLNHHLFMLYHYYFDELLSTEETREDLGNVIFYKELTYTGNLLKKAAIIQKQKQQPDIKFLTGKSEYVEIFGNDAMLVFFDQNENRCIGSAHWQIKPLWSKEQIDAYCEKCDGTNDHFLLYKSGGYLKKEKLSKEDFPEVLSVIGCTILNENVKQEIFEKVLAFYLENGEVEKLREALALVEFKSLPAENRIHMIEYFIAGGLYEEALKGIQQYGYDFLKPKYVKEVSIYALSALNHQKSELLVHMCAWAFEHGEYSKDMIEYLQRYFRGSKEEMLKIWDEGKKLDLYRTDFTEETLKVCGQDGVNGEEFHVFAQYLKTNDKKAWMIDAMLVEYMDYACRNEKELPDQFYELVGMKIDAGKTDRIYQGVYLKYYKNKSLNDRQKWRIQRIKELEMQTGDIFPDLFAFSEILDIPNYLYAKTFIEYKGEEGLRFTFHYTSARTRQWRNLVMKELMPGYYVVSDIIFSDEIVDCFLTLPGDEKRIRNNIHFVSHTEQSRGSRFYELDEMVKTRQDASIQEAMERYEIKKSMVEFIKPMTGE
ncbi:DUF5717 family protein [Anaerostipes sp. MSJ-23]|uniref:DUF5717 family protein n=2 Tax=unclassified Anaerostipes TaxID=2635253 RepID=UPI001C115D46|nr:hypothetical protein [Anaerostipes sp. MSJ-23]